MKHEHDCNCSECTGNEEMNNIVELIDDEGNAQPYEMLDYIESGKSSYIVITPAAEEEEAEECDVYIMRVVQEGEEDFFEVVEDQKELEKIFAIFQSHMDEYEAEEE